VAFYSYYFKININKNLSNKMIIKGKVVGLIYEEAKLQGYTDINDRID